MKTPLILRADDGISLWATASQLEMYVESPDIERGIYTAWDAEGQILQLSPADPVSHGSFLGIRSVSVSCGILTGTGRYDPETPRALIAAHIQGVLNYRGEIPNDLASIVVLLRSLEPTIN